MAGNSCNQQNYFFLNFRATCKGKAIPDDHVALLFFEAIDKILSKKKNALIGVHCTYGVNRTGYMICRYLIQKMGWNPQKAIGKQHALKKYDHSLLSILAAFGE